MPICESSVRFIFHFGESNLTRLASFLSRWIPLSTSLNSISSIKTLFINPVKLSSEASHYLDGLGIVVRPYDEVWTFLQEVGKSLSISTTEQKQSKKGVVLTGQSVTWKAQLAVGKVRFDFPEVEQTRTRLSCLTLSFRTRWKA